MPIDLPSSIATIDFEGSSLHGYPIEVGIAMWDLQAGEIRVWSTLIRPIPYWRKNATRWWDPRSERVHGLSQDRIEAGLHPRQVMHHLNALVGEHEVYCDGGPYDQAFLARLADAAGARPAFILGDLTGLGLRAELDEPGRMRLAALLAESAANVEHRAGPDAARLMQAAASAIGKNPSVVAGSPELVEEPTRTGRSQRRPA